MRIQKLKTPVLRLSYEENGPKNGEPILLVHAGTPAKTHIALVQFALQGALGDDYGNVYVRRSWLLFAEHVYQNVGGWDFANRRPAQPQVKWLDNTHLLIQYCCATDKRATHIRFPIFKPRVGNIEVICENTALPYSRRIFQFLLDGFAVQRRKRIQIPDGAFMKQSSSSVRPDPARLAARRDK